MKRLKADNHHPRTEGRVRLREITQHSEADDFVQFHLARVRLAKQLEEESWKKLAAYLATPASSPPKAVERKHEQRSRPRLR